MMLWILLLAGPLLLGFWAQHRVKSAFNKWKQVAVTSGVTGAQAAQRILQAAGIRDVEVLEIRDMLGDHYDPTQKRLCLSPEVYRTPSVAALGIAAHECGHAIQHQKAFVPLQWRMAVVPTTMIVSKILPFLLIGAIFIPHLAVKAIMVAAVCYAVLAVFQLITLPVEFDASRRAKIILKEMGMVQAGEEAGGVNQVLNAAAWTYVAAFVAVVAQLLYYVLILTGNRNN